VRGVDGRPAVVLAGEGGTGLQDLTGLLRFGGAYGGATVEAYSATEPLTAIQVQDDNLMAELGVARDGPGAAALGVARMTARDDDLEGWRGGSCQEGQRGGGEQRAA
jgi:hypothetical protein